MPNDVRHSLCLQAGQSSLWLKCGTMVERLWTRPSEVNRKRVTHSKHVTQRMVQLTFWLSAECKAEWKSLEVS